MKAGDKVRRKAAYRNDVWKHGDKVFTVAWSRSGNVSFEGVDCLWSADCFELVPSFKVGDMVRRKAAYRDDEWKHGDKVVTIAKVFDTEQSVSLTDYGNVRWRADRFEYAAKEGSARCHNGTWQEFRNGRWVNGMTVNFGIAPAFMRGPELVIPSTDEKVRRLYNKAVNGDVKLPDNVPGFPGSTMRPKRAAAYKAGYLKAMGEVMEALNMTTKVTLPAGRVVISKPGVDVLSPSKHADAPMVGDVVEWGFGLAKSRGVVQKIDEWQRVHIGTDVAGAPQFNIGVDSLQVIKRAPPMIGEKVRAYRQSDKYHIVGTLMTDDGNRVYVAEDSPMPGCTFNRSVKADEITDVYRNGYWVKL